MLDLQAAVHDHRNAAGIGDAGAFGVDHAELTPESTGADRDRVPGHLRERIWSAKDVDDVDRDRHVSEAGETLLAENLRLARVDRNDVIPVPLEVIPHEVAGAQ